MKTPLAPSQLTMSSKPYGLVVGGRLSFKGDKPKKKSKKREAKRPDDDDDDSVFALAQRRG